MDLVVKSAIPIQQKTACLVVPVYDKRRLGPSGQALDVLSNEGFSETLAAQAFSGESGHCLLLNGLAGIAAPRVLAVGCGKFGKTDQQSFRKLASKAAEKIANSGATDAISYLTEVEVTDAGIGWKTLQLGITASATSYRFTQCKSTSENTKAWSRMSLNVAETAELKAARKGAAAAEGIAKGMELCRDLGNLPPNICNPVYLAKEAGKLSKSYPALKVEILDQKTMQQLGMGALLAVAQGSDQAPRLIEIGYYNGGKRKPIVLIGKGITFDTGGISIKPAAAMDEMKYDMCGAASILGVMRSVAELELPLNIIGLVPSAENMPSGSACRPGDIVTSMSGHTVEILNTDAEGRLILCDALTYAAKFKPELIIDTATLTGACIIALGHHVSGLMSNDQALAQDLIQAGEISGDRCWQLPLFDEYQASLDSNFADFANVGGRPAGSITAACFLSRFVKKQRWAHLDIAGTAWRSGASKGATGRPVPLLMQYLLNRARRAPQ